MPFNKTGSTYFGRDSNVDYNSNGRGVVTAPQQASRQTTQNSTHIHAANEEAAMVSSANSQPAKAKATAKAEEIAKAPKTNNRGQKKSTPGSSKDDSRKESHWEWYISLSLSLSIFSLFLSQ